MANLEDLAAAPEPKPLLPYRLVRCASWNALVDDLRGLSRGWIFRGQLARWDLTTTLERYTPPGLKSEQERRLIAEFARRVDRHLLAGQTIRDRLEQLALMQHFGAPTRLLDFTHSPYVAAYFAFEEFEDSARTIWAVQVELLRPRAGEILRAAYPEIEKVVQIPGATKRIIDLVAT